MTHWQLVRGLEGWIYTTVIGKGYSQGLSYHPYPHPGPHHHPREGAGC